MKFKEAMEYRKLVHAYVLAHPGVSTDTVSKAHQVKMTRHTAAITMRYLCRNGYIGITGHGKSAVYHALTTFSADMVSPQGTPAVVRAKRIDAEPLMVVKSRPGLTSHTDQNRMPIPNQGGQGALRREVRTGCSLGGY